MKSFLFFTVLFLNLVVSAQNLECRRGENGESVSVKTLVSEIEEGSSLFLGELHGFDVVASGQLQILEELRRQGHKIDVALEFFTFTKQDAVDQFVQGLIEENTFLKQMEWARGMDFKDYRGQALFPNYKMGERTLAINSPQNITRAVARKGIDNLTEEELAMIPPQFELGRPEYYERFKELMSGGHVDEQSLQRYFQAQSVWDDTMAWQLTSKNSGNTTVVVVGEFHVQYGGGLPYRLSVRNPKMSIKTVGFMDISALSPDQINDSIKPHKSWGVREDYICLVHLPENAKVWSVFKGLGRSYR